MIPKVTVLGLYILGELTEKWRFFLAQFLDFMYGISELSYHTAIRRDLFICVVDPKGWNPAEATKRGKKESGIVWRHWGHTLKTGKHSIMYSMNTCIRRCLPPQKHTLENWTLFSRQPIEQKNLIKLVSSIILLTIYPRGLVDYSYQFSYIRRI